MTAARRVSGRGSIMAAKQKIHVGMIHASKTVAVTADSDHFTVTDGSETIAVVPAPPPGRSVVTRPTPHSVPQRRTALRSETMSTRNSHRPPAI
jgi:hypothetical protein